MRESYFQGRGNFEYGRPKQKETDGSHSIVKEEPKTPDDGLE